MPRPFSFLTYLLPHENKACHTTRVSPGFSSMKQLEVFLLPASCLRVSPSIRSGVRRANHKAHVSLTFFLNIPFIKESMVMENVFAVHTVLQVLQALFAQEIDFGLRVAFSAFYLEY